MNFKFDGWLWKTVDHLFCAASRFVHHFIAISEINLVNLELQSENAPFGSKSVILVPCDLEIWQMTLKNNRAPLLCYFKLCASFHIAIGEFKLELQSGNAQFGWKSTIFLAMWPWNLTDHLEKTIRHLILTTSNFVHHFIAIDQFKLELQSGNTKFGSKSAIFCPVWPWNVMDDLEKQLATSPMPHEALCTISSPYVNSNQSYSPKTAKLGFDLCDLDHWPLTFTFCMDITSVNGTDGQMDGLDH